MAEANSLRRAPRGVLVLFLFHPHDFTVADRLPRRFDTRSCGVTPVEISSVVPRSRAMVIVLSRTRFIVDRRELGLAIKENQRARGN